MFSVATKHRRNPFCVRRTGYTYLVKQHFVPKFLIEGFVNEQEPGNRGVWVYRASDRRWSKRSTKKVAALEDFYTFVEANGVRDDTTEDFMAKIERQFAPFFAMQSPFAGPSRHRSPSI